MVDAMLRLSWIQCTSTVEKGQADRCVPGVCQGTNEVSELLPGHTDRHLGQDVSWLDPPSSSGVLPWIGKEPSGCANQYRPSLAPNPFNIIAWKWITFCFLAQLQPRSLLEVSDTIICLWNTPLPPSLSLDPCFDDSKVFVSFTINCLKPFQEGGGVPLF